MDIHRLLLLGDSFTFGPFVDNHELTSAQLQTLLNKENTVALFEVVNAAMSGWTLIDPFEYLREKGLRLQPSIVSMSFYINDIREFNPFFRTPSTGGSIESKAKHRSLKFGYSCATIQRPIPCCAILKIASISPPPRPASALPPPTITALSGRPTSNASTRSPPCCKNNTSPALHPHTRKRSPHRARLAHTT